jgi:hypothetical protein
MCLFSLGLVVMQTQPRGIAKKALLATYGVQSSSTLFNIANSQSPLINDPTR